MCRRLSVMGYSWECGRLLLRISHNYSLFCGILKQISVSKIFTRHWLYERSRSFARSYSDLTKIHTSVFTPSEIYIQWVKRYLSRKMNWDWGEVLNVDYLNSISCWGKLDKLDITPYFEYIITIYIHCSVRFIICNVVHRCCFTSYRKILTSYEDNQTLFKTKEKYGFDSLISNVVLTLKNCITLHRFVCIHVVTMFWFAGMVSRFRN